MGKIIKHLINKEFNNQKFTIELNKDPSQKSKKNIHISFNKARIELSKSEFYELCGSLLLSEQNLKNLKNID